MYCPTCGHILKGSEKFCGRCGTRIEIPEEGADNAPQQTVTQPHPDVAPQQRGVEPGDEALGTMSSGAPVSQQSAAASPDVAPQQAATSRGVVSPHPNVAPLPGQGVVSGRCTVNAAATGPQFTGIPTVASSAPAQKNVVLIAAIAVAAVAVICLCIVLVMNFTHANASQRHLVALAAVTGQGYDASDSRVPVQVAGTCDDGSTFDEQQYVGPDGTGLELPSGSYSLVVLASPLTDDGTFYESSVASYEVTVNTTQTSSSGTVSSQTRIELAVKDSQKVTEADIEKTTKYAEHDDTFDQDKVEPYKQEAEKRAGISSQARNAAFAEVCCQLISKYGEPRSYNPDKYQGYAIGLCYADVLDMDGDGKEELFVVVGSINSKTVTEYHPKIYTYANGQAQETFASDIIGSEGTNGWLPSFYLYERVGGGYAFEHLGCNGSSPTKYCTTLYGFRAGESQIAMRSRVRELTASDWTYYSGKYETKISEEQYNQIYSAVITDQSNPVQHIHLYTMSSDDGKGTYSLEIAKETLAELGVVYN